MQQNQLSSVDSRKVDGRTRIIVYFYPKIIQLMILSIIQHSIVHFNWFLWSSILKYMLYSAANDTKLAVVLFINESLVCFSQVVRNESRKWSQEEIIKYIYIIMMVAIIRHAKPINKLVCNEYNILHIVNLLHWQYRIGNAICII